MNAPATDLALAPLGAGDLIDRAVRLYRRHFLTLIRIAAPPVIVSAAGSTLTTIAFRAIGATPSPPHGGPTPVGVSGRDPHFPIRCGARSSSEIKAVAQQAVDLNPGPSSGPLTCGFHRFRSVRLRPAVARGEL